jgi:hypothetical protein
MSKKKKKRRAKIKLIAKLLIGLGTILTGLASLIEALH